MISKGLVKKDESIEIKGNDKIEKPSNYEGQTPLHIAINQGNLELAKELISKGADINAVTNFWHTPLHYAVNRGGFEIVKLLIENGAKINALSNFDYAPLHYAANQGKVKVAQFLIAKGAALNIQNTFGHTPLHCTANHTRTNIDCDSCNNGRYNFCGAVYGRIEIAKLLVQKGAKIYLEDEDGFTPLELARKSGYIEIVKLIEEYKLKNSKK
jgi:ankyrin repeat protein